MKKILIYNDKGADTFSVNSLHAALCLERIDHQYSIAWADKKLIESKQWIKDTHLLIFPGGRDIPYHEALKGLPNDYIREFVQNGGRYMGICAGSYYGCAAFEFEKGGDIEVIAERELKFFPGIAIGPAFGNGKFCYRSQRGGQIATLVNCPTFSNSWTSAAYFNGGCYFAKAEDYADVSILARYQEVVDQPAAIIQCKVGKGKALLCGVHPEYSALFAVKPTCFSEDQKLKLQEIETTRRRLFSELLLHCLN